jgi:hypothetical protein
MAVDHLKCCTSTEFSEADASVTMEYDKWNMSCVISRDTLKFLGVQQCAFFNVHLANVSFSNKSLSLQLNRRSV